MSSFTVPSAKHFPFIFCSNGSDLRRLVILLHRVQVLYGLHENAPLILYAIPLRAQCIISLVAHMSSIEAHATYYHISQIDTG